MPREEAYLIRQADGTMVTVQAFSPRGARDAYLRKYRPAKGTQFSVKPRGGGAFDHYDVI